MTIGKGFIMRNIKKYLTTGIISLGFLGLVSSCSYLGEQISLVEASEFVEKNFVPTTADKYDLGTATSTIEVKKVSDELKDILKQLNYNIDKPQVVTEDVQPVVLSRVDLETLSATAPSGSDVKYYLNNGIELGVTTDLTQTVAIPDTEISLEASTHTEYVYTSEGLPFTTDVTLVLKMENEEKQASATIVTSTEYSFPTKAVAE